MVLGNPPPFPIKGVGFILSNVFFLSSFRFSATKYIHLRILRNKNLVGKVFNHSGTRAREEDACFFYP